MQAPVSPQPVKRYTRKTFDKFTDRTDTHWVDPLGGKLFGAPWAPVFWAKLDGERFGDKIFADKLNMSIRHAKNPKIDAIVIDYDFRAIDWMFLRDGVMTINLNDVENVLLSPYETKTETGGSGTTAVHVIEQGHWNITKEQLKQICDADKVDIRISGASYHIDLNTKGVLKFRFMCRSFYAELYDDHLYDAWLTSIVPAGTEGQKDRWWYLFLGYGSILFFPMLAIGLGLYLVLGKRTMNDGSKVHAFSSSYRTHGKIVLGLSAALILFVVYILSLGK